MPTPSLIIPSAPVYDEGLLYGLNVYGTNFVPEPIPFTRATTATRTNAAGLIEFAPYNLLSYSEVFSNAYWFKQNSSVLSNVIAAPDGTLTADKLVADTTLGQHRMYGIGPNSDAGTYTYSVYAKAGEYGYLSLGSSGGISGGNIIFNLLNGTISGTAGAITTSIESVGDGWYRCIFSALNTAASLSWWIVARNANNTSDYTGNGSDGLFIWGAQLVQGTAALPYLKTETRLNIPRVDYSLGGCPNLLLEPQRTNLALQSSSFDSATWTKTASSVTANATTSPSGIVDADTLTADGTLTFHQASQSVSVTSGTTYTYSIYAKKNTNNFIQLTPSQAIFGSNVWANFDLNNGVVGSVGSSTTASIQSVGNGWYRCIITGAATATASGTFAAIIVTSATSVRAETNTLNTSVFLWGAQLEAGAYPTTLIPTLATSVTRNADLFTESNIFSRGMITAAGGTWFIEFRNNVPVLRDLSAVGLFIGDSSAGLTNSFSISGQGASARLRINKYVAGVFTSLFTTTANTCKIAIKWNGSTADIFENGVKVVSATAFTATALEFLAQSTTMDVVKNIQQMALYPTPLSDTELISMTTI